MTGTFYVYSHICPVTNETKYVGYGQKQRAWMTELGHRSQPHCDWLNQMFEQGFTMQNIVNMIATRLSKSEAKHIEKEHITSHQPIFNNHYTGKRRYRTSRQADEESLSYRALAEKRGVSIMTVWRGLNAA